MNIGDMLNTGLMGHLNQSSQNGQLPIGIGLQALVKGLQPQQQQQKEPRRFMDRLMGLGRNEDLGGGWQYSYDSPMRKPDVDPHFYKDDHLYYGPSPRKMPGYQGGM